MKISAVYKIVNIITGDFYIGSSKDVKRRWRKHKKPSTWRKCPNNPMYLDMQKYGTDKFDFQILANVESEQLKEAEQKFIEILKPIYNKNNAKGLDIERWKEYRQSEKCRKSKRKASAKYYNRLCFYNGETLTLGTLAKRFKRAGIEHYVLEAKKYLLNKEF